MFATAPDLPLVIAVIAGLAALTGFGLWFRRRQGQVKLASGESRSIAAAELAGPLGEAATLVMFSTRFCSICPGARAFFESLVAEIGADVCFYEIDAEKQLALAKKFGVKSTPTTLVLNAQGEVAARIIGAPNRANTLAILRDVGGVEPAVIAKGASA